MIVSVAKEGNEDILADEGRKLHIVDGTGEKAML